MAGKKLLVVPHHNMNVRIPQTLYDRIAKQAAANYRPVGAEVRMLLDTIMGPEPK